MKMQELILSIFAACFASTASAQKMPDGKLPKMRASYIYVRQKSHAEYQAPTPFNNADLK